jgi:hypothetical protein
MKKFILTIAMIFASSVIAIAQQCKVQGLVQYKFNDYVGYKIDAGAEIGVISLENAKKLGFNKKDWEDYDRLSKDYIKYLEVKNDPEITDVNLFLQLLGVKFTNKEKELLDSLDSKCLSQYLEISSNYEYIELVDASGKYALTLPYGEYYIFAKSKNRERALVLELTGRILMEEIKIDKPTKIVSFDFDY